MAALACLAVGFLAGFVGGFRIAAMIQLSVQRVLPPAAVDKVLEEEDA